MFACAAPTAPPAPPVAAPGVAQARWLVGSWSDGRSTEHWWDGGHALAGVAFMGDRVEVAVIEPQAGGLAYRVNPLDQKEVSFAAELLDSGRMRFVNAAHDYPVSIEYRRVGTGIAAAIAGKDGSDPVAWDYAPALREPAPELEEADRRFAADAALRGAAAWAAAFDAAGQMDRGGRVVGPDAIFALMAPGYAAGVQLAWAPEYSVRQGELGFTAGHWQATQAGSPAGSGIYATVWKQQADGGWKVLFDDGSVAP